MNNMKYVFQVIVILFFFTVSTNLNAQIKMNYTKAKDTTATKLKLFDIEIGEIDSPKFELSGRLDNYADSCYYRGSLIKAFKHILNIDWAFIKVSGIVPNKFIQYHIYSNYEQKVYPQFFTGTNVYKETILTALKGYYRCKIEKVTEFTDVYVLYKVDKSKLMRNPPIESDTLYGHYLQNKNGIKYSIYDDVILNNQFLGFSYLLTNYLKLIFISDEKDIDDTSYYFKFEVNEESTIEGLEKGLLRHGIKLVKEQRLQEIYHIDFY
jgi:hypothetical protein